MKNIFKMQRTTTRGMQYWMNNVTDVHTVAIRSVHTVMSLVFVVDDELFWISCDVVCSACLSVPVDVDAIGSSIDLLVIMINFIISVITMAPPVVTGWVTTNLAYVAANIHKGGRGAVMSTTPTIPSRRRSS
jgi:hypothetical protein